MKSIIPDEELKKIVDGSRGSVYRIVIDNTVSVRFHNIRFLTSRLVADCVLLNTLLNDEITENSADEIIRFVARRNRAFYTNIESIYRSIDTQFIEYAKNVLGDDYDEEFGTKTAHFIVYVLSVDCARNNNAPRESLFNRIYGYEELLQGIPNYKKTT